MTNSQQQISTETALRLLAESRRRRIIQHIANTAGGTTVDQLTNGQEGTTTAPSRGKETTNTKRILDHHVHLPQLDGADVIEYSATQGTVQRGQHFEDLFSLLEIIESRPEDTGIRSP